MKKKICGDCFHKHTFPFDRINHKAVYFCELTNKGKRKYKIKICVNEDSKACHYFRDLKKWRELWFKNYQKKKLLDRKP